MDTKPFYQSKTLWINGLIILAALLVYVSGPDFPVQLDDATLKALVGALGVINILLRFATNTGLGK